METFNTLLTLSELKEHYSDKPVGICPLYKGSIGATKRIEAAGNPVTIPKYEQLEKLAIEFSPKQAGSGDPGPDNVRPITGWDSVQVTRCGKNLFNGDVIDVIQNGVSIKSNGDGTYHVTGTNTSDNWVSVKIGEIDIPAGTYVFSGSNSSSPYSMRIRLLRTQSGGLNGDNADRPLVQTITGGRSMVYIQFNSGATIDILSKPMLELGSTPTDYEPYQGDTYDISLPETIYGGTVDAVTGEGEKTWGYIASYNGESLPGEWISDRDVYAPGTTPTTGAQVAYKLAAPEPFKTSQYSISSLESENTFFTNGENLDIIYKVSSFWG